MPRRMFFHGHDLFNDDDDDENGVDSSATSDLFLDFVLFSLCGIYGWKGGWDACVIWARHKEWDVAG